MFGIHVDLLDDGTPRQMTHLAAMVASRGFELAVEAGGTDPDWGCDELNGESSAQLELRKLDRYFAVGGAVDYLVLDGPLSRVIAGGRAENCGWTLAQGIEELVDYFQAVHAIRPEIRIGLLVNFPNWSYKGLPSYFPDIDHGDYHEALTQLVAALALEGESIELLLADNPYNYASGAVPSPHAKAVDWMGRLLALEADAEALGLLFGPIYNTSMTGLFDAHFPTPQPPHSESEAFELYTLAFIAEYQARGGSPDFRVIESWYPYPTYAVPETTPWTFTHLVNAALELYAP